MKFNGKNIINDTDITLSNGHSLKDVVDEINTLKSNIKFIYKHGTLGGGYGNGGGSYSKTLNMRFYMQQDTGMIPVEDGAQILYSKPGYRNIQLKLYGTNEETTYQITIYYENGLNKTYRLNSSNDFSLNDSLNLMSNSNLTIEAIDRSSGENHTLTCSYITSIYSISSPNIIQGYIKTKNDWNSLNANDISVVQDNNLIFMNSLMSFGLVLGFSCTFTMPPTEDSFIRFSDWIGNSYKIPLHAIGISTERSSKQSIFFNLTGDNIFEEYKEINKGNIDIKEFLSNTENAGLYEYRLEFNINIIDTKQETHTINDVYNFKNNLIPSTLFLMISPNGGKLFNKNTAIDDILNANDDEKFLLGSSLMYVTPFYGNKVDSRIHQLSVNVEYNYNEESEEFTNNIQILDRHTIKDQQKESISISLPSPGINKINFLLTCESEKYEVSYYASIKNLSSNFNWFRPYKLNRINSDIYKSNHASFKENRIGNIDNINIIDENNNNLNSFSTIKMSSNSGGKFYKFDITDGNFTEGFDQLLEVSLQYSKINNISQPIFSLNATGSTSTSIKPWSIFVYQNKIVLTGSQSIITNNEVSIGSSVMSRDLYIPLCENINPGDTSLYTLLTLYKNLESIDGNNKYYGLYAMIDGIYDSALSGFNSSYSLFDSITFYPGNYSVNIIETLVLPHSGNEQENVVTYITEQGTTATDIRYMTQYDLEYYFNSYETTYRNNGTNIDEDELALIQQFSEFSYDEDIQMVRCTGSSASNIAEHIDIPVLLLSYVNNDPNRTVNGITGGLEKWLGQSLSQEETGGPNIPVKIQWSSGSKSSLKHILFENEELDFSINLQGSTTKQYKAKNLELYAPQSDESGVYVYSPNIAHNENSKEFNDMLLPEQSFTLKADVVDSSHSNNNAIGNFINDNLTEFGAPKTIHERSGVLSKYIKKIKKCLTGFPILVFLNTTYDYNNEREDNFYYLGIYNFNLGRHSHFNLGYNNLNIIQNAIENSDEEGFVIYKLTERIVRIPDLYVAEIQLNNQYFDFSQYDPSILYSLSDKDEGQMWGDIVYGTNEVQQTSGLTRLMKYVSNVGGYIFAKIGKGFSENPEDNYGYKYWYSPVDENNNPIENVPNFMYQAKRIINSDGQNQYSFERIPGASLDPTSNFMIGLENDFKRTLSTKKDENTPNVPVLDYISISEYYTTCMAFGMIDSVQKNFNIKSWTNKGLEIANDINSDESNIGTFYAAFYDMDTGLGITNTGKRMTYFSFSDYWQSIIDDEELKPVKVVRDWSPSSTHNNDEDVSFFDVPSSYLFAIAKYAPVIQKDGWDDEYSSFNRNPSNIWAEWRRSNGCLRNAKYFMDKYFNSHLGNVPASALNWNYRYKYFVKTKGDTSGFNNLNFMKFYGTKRSYTENWLSNRLHIMDAYMNLISNQQLIHEGLPYKILSPTVELDRNNKDIILFREIFIDSQEYVSFNSDNIQGNVTLTGVPYSPMAIYNQGQAPIMYLLPNTNDELKISIPYISGNPYYKFYGSTNWYSLDPIDKFITNGHTLTINSEYFSELRSSNQSRISCNSWSLNIPSIKNISLTSNNFSGSIDLSNDEHGYYPNLTSVDISNTAINFTSTNTDLITLIAKNMRSGASINCTNTSSLNNVQLSGNISSIIIDAWSENIRIPYDNTSIGATNITITNKKFENVFVEIYNAQNLETLVLDNCTGLKITNCPNLKTLVITNVDDTCKFTSLEINVNTYSSIEPTNLEMKIGSNSNITPGIADLSNLKYLNKLSITNSPIQKIILPENCDIYLKEGAFLHNIYFKGFENISENKSKLILTGNSTFIDCQNFSLIEQKYVINESTGEYEYADPYDYIDLYVDPNCKDLSYTFKIDIYRFGNLTITYGSLTLPEVKHFLDMCTEERVSNVENINGMFEGQSITYDHATGIDEYNNTECSLSLKNFSKCYLFSNIFRYTNVTFYNRYMFGGNFAKNANIPNGMTFSTPLLPNSGMTLYATVDFLYEIIDKINHLRLSSNRPITLLLNSGVEIGGTKIWLQQIFSDIEHNIYPIKLAYIESFNIGNINALYDFNGLFNSNWTKAKNDGLGLYEFMNVGTYKVETYEDCGLGDLFKDIKLLHLISSFSNISSIEKDPTYVDISNFLDWENGISNMESIGSTSSSDYNVGTSFGFKKKLTYERFHEIMSYLLGFYWTGKGIPENNKNEKLESICDLFSNCTLFETEEYTVGNNLLLVNLKYKDLKCENIKKIDNLFRGLTLKNRNSEDLPLPLTWQTLYCLPNLISLKHTFRGISVKYPISYDFFHKRKQYNPIDVYLNEESTVRGKLYAYYYSNNLSNINGCFADMNFNLEYEANGNKVKPFEYNGIYNKDFDGNHVLKEDYVEDENGNKYDYFYHDGIKYDLIEPSEKLDALKAQEQYYSTYSRVIMNKYGDEDNNLLNATGKTYTSNIYAYTSDGYSGTFTAPDILYGCSPRTDIQDLFNCFGSDIDISAENSIKVEYLPRFSGTIPEHMLYRVSNIENVIKSTLIDIRSISFIGLFTNLNILPINLNIDITIGSTIHKFYKFIPTNFSNRINLANAFTFKLLLPSYTDSVVEHFFIYMRDSISKDVESLSNSISYPLSCQLGIKGRNMETIYDYSIIGIDNMRFPIYFNVMGNIVEDDEKIYVKEGFDMEYFKSLKLDGIFNEKLMKIIFGNLFSTKITNESSWNRSYINYNDPERGNYLINLESGGASYFSRFFIPAGNNANFIKGSGNSQKSIPINKDSAIIPNDTQRFYKLFKQTENSIENPYPMEFYKIK